jgi:hypothetical protein
MRMELLDTIYYKDYRIEIVPDTEAGNPLKEGEFAPTLVKEVS